MKNNICRAGNYVCVMTLYNKGLVVALQISVPILTIMLLFSLSYTVEYV